MKQADKDALVLLRHGTKPVGLTPNAIVQAAKQDLRNREFNSRVRAERKSRKLKIAAGEAATLKDLDTTRPYGFLPENVRAATSPAHLLALALDVAPVVQTALDDRTDLKLIKWSVETIRLHADTDLLRQALEIARAEEAPQAA